VETSFELETSSHGKARSEEKQLFASTDPPAINYSLPDSLAWKEQVRVFIL
jgi:hypothetical protein